MLGGSIWISQEQEIFILLSCKKKKRQKKGYVYMCVKFLYILKLPVDHKFRRGKTLLL